MKILKHGNIQSKVKTCPKCNCEFVYDSILDINIEHGVWGSTSYVECPECREKMYLNTGYCATLTE